MLFQPRYEPLIVELNDADERLMRVCDQVADLLALSVCALNGLRQFIVCQFARVPTLEVIVERLQRLPPVIIEIGVDQGLFPFAVG